MQVTTMSWPATSPEGILLRAFQAFGERDGLALAALASRSSLDYYKSRIVAEITSTWKEWTVDEVLSYHPGMPREAAEWEVQGRKRAKANGEASLLSRFRGVASTDELRSLSASELLERALKTAPVGLATYRECIPVGHVREGASTAYVIFRFRWRDPDGKDNLESPEMATMSKEEDEWRLDLDDGYLGMPGFRNIIFIGSDAEPPAAGADVKN